MLRLVLKGDRLTVAFLSVAFGLKAGGAEKKIKRIVHSPMADFISFLLRWVSLRSVLFQCGFFFQTHCLINVISYLNFWFRFLGLFKVHVFEISKENLKEIPCFDKLYRPKFTSKNFQKTT